VLSLVRADLAFERSIWEVVWTLINVDVFRFLLIGSAASK